MARHIHLLVISLILAFGLIGSEAASYYVATTGSDTTGDGSSGNPWRSIGHGASNAVSGDFVLVQPGIYDERPGLRNDGITLLADGAVTNRGTLWIYTNDITISGFDLTADSDLVNLGAILYNWTGITNGLIKSNRIHDTKYLYPGGGINIENNGGTSWVFNITITNNMIYNLLGNMASIRGYSNLVVDNVFSNTYGGDALWLYGGNHIVRGNVFKDISAKYTALYGFGNSAFDGTYVLDTNAAVTLWDADTNSTVEQIIVWKHPDSDIYLVSFEAWSTNNTHGWSNHYNLVNAETHFYAHADASFATWTWTLLDEVIVSTPTRCLGATGHPDWLQSDGPNTPSTYKPGLTSTNMLIERNILTGGEACAIVNVSYPGTNYGECGNWTFKNNVFIRVGQAGGVNWPEFKFYNNTFYKCGYALYGDAASPLNFGWYTNSSLFTWRGCAYNCEVKNNAFVGCGMDATNSGWYGLGTLPQFNYYFDPPIDLWTNCDYNYVGTLAGLQKRTNATYPGTNYYWSEPNGVNGGDVKFVNAELGDFRIMLGSVLIDAGATLASNDYYGFLRPMGDAVEIGAFEYDPHLKLHLDFAYITETNVQDITGNAGHGWNLQGTNWIYETNGPNGITAGHWYTNGITDWSGTYPNATFLAVTNVGAITNKTNFTLSVWTKTEPSQQDSVQMIAGSGYASVGSDYWNLLSNSWVFRRYIKTNFYWMTCKTNYSETNLFFPGDTTGGFGSLVQNDWHHYAVTIDCQSGEITGYHDGVPFKTNSIALPYVAIYGNNSQRWLCIGADPHARLIGWGDSTHGPNDSFFVGGMADFRIYDRVLAADEVAHLYDLTSTVSGGGAESAPALSISPTTLTITTLSNSVDLTTNYLVWNSGDTSELLYTNTEAAAWMVLDPLTGSSSGEQDTITMTLDRDVVGTNQANVTVSWSNAVSQTLSVTLRVTNGVAAGGVTNLQKVILRGAKVTARGGVTFR